MLWIVLLVRTSWQSVAFCPCPRITTAALRSTTWVPNQPAVLFASDDEDPSQVDEPDKTQPLVNVQTLILQVANFLYYTFSFFLTVIGMTLSLGLLLNLAGYAYQITDHGVDIDTIAHFRERLDFQAAVRASMMGR